MGARIVTALAIIGAAGCTQTGSPEPVAFSAPAASYLSADLIAVSLEVSGAPTREALRAVTDCAAAEAARLRGDNFLRHVRTSREDEGGISRADAVYSVSKELPAGAFVLDAAIVAANCRAEGTSGV